LFVESSVRASGFSDDNLLWSAFIRFFLFTVSREKLSFLAPEVLMSTTTCLSLDRTVVFAIIDVAVFWRHFDAGTLAFPGSSNPSPL